VPEKPENVKMMEIMDRHLTDHPTEGVMSIVLFFIARRYPVGPKRIRRLLKIMGRQTIYQRENLTKAGMKMFIKPYLLKGLEINRPNKVWCTDITYIPMRNGFMYLTAIMDVYIRKIVGWGISNSLAASWCKEVLEEAIFRNGKPEILNSDQGCQYTSAIRTQYLEQQGIQISMDGKVRALDNVWIESFIGLSNTITFIRIPPMMVLNCMKAFKTTAATITTRYTTRRWKLPMTGMKKP
jgi:putative transposase